MGRGLRLISNLSLLCAQAEGMVLGERDKNCIVYRVVQVMPT